MKTLLIAALVIASSCSYAEQVIPAALTPNMKRAQNIEVQEVKTLPEDKATVLAVLTYKDGTKAKCEYNMRIELIDAEDRQGVQFLPASERCTPLIARENHYFKCAWPGWKDSSQCKDYTPAP